MIKIETFIKEELDDTTREKLMKLIQNPQEKKSESIIYNRFSLEIFYDKNIIIIYDDIFPSSNPIKKNINEFVALIK